VTLSRSQDDPRPPVGGHRAPRRAPPPFSCVAPALRPCGASGRARGARSGGARRTAPCDRRRRRVVARCAVPRDAVPWPGACRGEDPVSIRSSPALRVNATDDARDVRRHARRCAPCRRSVAFPWRNGTAHRLDEEIRYGSTMPTGCDGAPPAVLRDAFDWCTRTHPTKRPPRSLLWGDGPARQRALTDSATRSLRCSTGARIARAGGDGRRFGTWHSTIHREVTGRRVERLLERELDRPLLGATRTRVARLPLDEIFALARSIAVNDKLARIAGRSATAIQGWPARQPMLRLLAATQSIAGSRVTTSFTSAVRRDDSGRGSGRDRDRYQRSRSPRCHPMSNRSRRCADHRAVGSTSGPPEFPS